MAIYGGKEDIGTKEVTAIYLGKKVISAAYKRFHLIFSSFSRIWKDKHVWKDKNIWKS